MQLVLRLVINAFAIWLAATWIDKIDIISPEDQGNGAKIVTLLAVAAVVSAVEGLGQALVEVLLVARVVVPSLSMRAVFSRCKCAYCSSM
ncbi:hypothetical protein [Nocardia cyriacigeorgica]|uniref:hypothetical protein n=1 Tax=Nocardia cyriacigeorgica TaxID=135487 RepID=UPI002455B8F3|nr:hypothetical protein [Nocardia cyriacigeorgica]